jgi:hypothetical protein
MSNAKCLVYKTKNKSELVLCYRYSSKMGVNCIGNFIICSLRIILVGNKREKCREESSLFETLN